MGLKLERSKELGMSFWDGKRVVVTVAQALLALLCRELRERGCRNVIVRVRRNMTARPRRDRATVQGNEASHRFHLAGVVGGIGANRSESGTVLL